MDLLKYPVVTNYAEGKDAMNIEHEMEEPLNEI